MRTYSYAKGYLNDEEKGRLDIVGEHNTYSVYEYDANVFSGTWSKAIEYIEGWKSRNKAIADMLNMDIRFEQTIG